MSPDSAGGRIAPAVLAALAALAIAPSSPRPAAAAECPAAFVEMRPSPAPLLDQGWPVPSGGTWIEVSPVPGQEHPQYRYLDQSPLGLVSKTDAFVERPDLTPWFVAGVGTMLHLTPVEFLPDGGTMPIGDPVVAWWPEFYFRREPRGDGRLWFVVPDSVQVQAPGCCAWLRVVDWLAGGVVGNAPPSVLRLQGATVPEPVWFRVDERNCGLWITPDLATGAPRASWGRVRIRYR